MVSLVNQGFAHQAQQNVQVFLDFLGGREDIAGAVIAGEGIGRSAGLGIEAEGIALGRFAHFVFQEMGRAGRQGHRLAVQGKLAVDGAKSGGIDGMHTAVARHGAAEHRQAAGQHHLLTADGCGGPGLGGGESFVIGHLRRLLSHGCRVWAVTV